MRATSQASLTAAIERWEPIVSSAGASAADYGEQLFVVVDALDSSAALRRALTEPSREGDAKATLATNVFAGQVSSDVADLLTGLARGRWSAEADFAEAVEQLALTSLLTAAESRGALADLEEDVFRMTRVLADNRDLRLALADRDTPAEQRVALLAEVFTEHVGTETMTLAARAVGSPRSRSVTAGLVQISELAATRRRQLLAVVTAAVPLSREQHDRLVRMLSDAYGRTMQVNVAVDPAVVGGLRIQIGDELVDATVLTRLDEARRRLAG